MTDYLSEGQTVRVKVLDVDQRGRIKLSMKEVAENSAEATGEEGLKIEPLIKERSSGRLEVKQKGRRVCAAFFLAVLLSVTSRSNGVRRSEHAASGQLIALTSAPICTQIFNHGGVCEGRCIAQVIKSFSAIFAGSRRMIFPSAFW